VAYGLSTSDPYLIVPNVVGVITNVATLVIVRRYRTRAEPVGG
jgi:lipid-A-disaccharide synthase-like uncharacterized protein